MTTEIDRIPLCMQPLFGQFERRGLYGKITLQVPTRTHGLLLHSMEDGRTLHVWAGSDRWFLVEHRWEVNLSLDEPSCNCREYGQTGIPCRQMVAAFLYPLQEGQTANRSTLATNLGDYADPHYRTVTLAQVYKEIIIP
jgi:hypothetical protein